MRSAALVITALLSLAIDRGPWLLIGRVPDRNPYTCSASGSGTYVPGSASITDSACAVWTLGAGSSPNIVILRNGSQADAAFGAQIEYYLGALYVQGDDLNWYLWDNTLGGFGFFSSTDPSMSITPVGYFVSTTGTNGTCGQAAVSATPARTLNFAVSCLTPGDTLYVRGGTYVEALLSGIPSGTSWTSKVRITNYPSETVTMAPTTGNYVVFFNAGEHYIEFDGINLDGRGTSGPDVVFMPTGGNSHHIRMQNAEIIGSPTAGFCANICGGESSEWINLVVHGGAESNNGCGTACGNYGWYSGGANNLVDGCEFYAMKAEGINIYNSLGPQYPNNNIIRNNRVHDIIVSGDPNPGARFSGIFVGGGTGNLIYNNVVWNVGRSDGASTNAGITIFGGSTSTRLLNNTIYTVYNYGISVESGGPTSSFVQNNVVYLSSGAGLSDAGSGTTKTNNMVLGVDPLFASVGTNNFRLTAPSPGRDTGTPLASFFTTDLEAIPRPQGAQWDIGAYEYH